MKKLTLVAAAGVLSLGMAGAITPALAANIASCENDLDVIAGNYTDAIAQDAPAILASLHAKGINAQDVSNWGGCIKADVVRKDGHTAMQFFEPGTLQRLHVNNG